MIAATTTSLSAAEGGEVQDSSSVPVTAQKAWSAAVSNQQGGDPSDVVAVIGPGSYGQSDPGLHLTAMLLGGSPLRLIGPGPSNPAMRADVPAAGMMQANTNNLQYSAPGMIVSQQNEFLGRGVAPAAVLNSATLKPHQNTKLVFNTIADGSGLYAQLGSLPANALVISTNDPMATTQAIATLRPDVSRNFGLVGPVPQVGDVADLFSANSPNHPYRDPEAPPSGLAAARQAQEARELASVLAPGAAPGTTVAAVPLDGMTAAVLSAYVSQASGQPINVPAGTVIAAPVMHGTGRINIPALLRAVDLSPHIAVACLQARVEARSMGAAQAAQVAVERGSLPISGPAVLSFPQTALTFLGSAKPTPGAREGNDRPFTVIDIAEHRQALGKVAVIGATGSIGGLQVSQLIGKGLDTTAVSRTQPETLPHGVPWSSVVPADTKTVFLSASGKIPLRGDGKPDRALALVANLRDIIAPLIPTLPQGVTVIVTMNPVNEIASILKAARPDLMVVADNFSDTARAKMFTVMQGGPATPLILGPHNDSMIAIGGNDKIVPLVPRYGIGVAMRSINADRTVQSSTMPTGAAAITGIVKALSGRSAAVAPILGTANAAKLSAVLGVPMNPNVSFSAPFTYDAMSKTWTIDTTEIEKFLAVPANRETLYCPANMMPELATPMAEFAARVENRTVGSVELAKKINTAFTTSITSADAASILNAPTTRRLILQSVAHVANEDWAVAANAFAKIIHARNPDVSAIAAFALLDQGGALPDGRTVPMLMAPR